MRALRSIVFTGLFFAWTAFVLVGLVFFLPLPRQATMAGVRGWSRVMSALARALVGIRHEVRGQDNMVPGAAIYASKHQSAWDTAIFLALLPDPAYVMKSELFRIPFWGWCARKAEAIRVERKGGGAALRRMVRDCRRALEGGRQVVIFPEGTRVPPGAVRGYHPGVAAVYQAAPDVPVVPVALNSGVFWGRRSLLKRPGTIVIEFLPALPSGLDRRAFMAALEERIETATRALEREAGAPGAG